MEDIFYKLVEKNPNKGIPTKLEVIHKGENKLRDKIIVPGWFIGENEDKLVLMNRINTFLSQYGLNSQLLYDIVELGLTDPSQRPKCKNPNCINPVKFKSINFGYLSCCSRRCSYEIGYDARNTAEAKEKKHNKLFGRKMPPRSEEYKEKQRIARTGRKQSKETIDKRMRTMRINRENGKVRKPMSEESRKRISMRNKGRKCTPESIQKGLETKRIHKLEAEARGEIYPKRNPNQRTRKGQKVSEESRMKMSISQKNRDQTNYRTEEYRIKMSKRSSLYFKENPDKLQEFILNGKFGSKRGRVKLDKYSNPKGFYFMSSWEKSFLLDFDADDNVVRIFNPEILMYEHPFKLEDRMYLPDIGLELEDKTILIIEVKPLEYINDPVVVAKRKAGISYCKRNGYSYITLTENELNMRNLTIDYILNVVKYKYYNY